MDGVVLGYDPGGNNAHGVASILVVADRVSYATTDTLETAAAVLNWLENSDYPLALGIDTLTYWSTGWAGWRPADQWLRKQYPEVQASVVNPNFLMGAMALNGMSVLIQTRQRHPDLPIIEAHPKVLYWALTGQKYRYATDSDVMDQELSKWLGVPIETNNDHEWDALISALAALKGVNGQWQNDLAQENAGDIPSLVFPCGEVNYWWPE